MQGLAFFEIGFGEIRIKRGGVNVESDARLEKVHHDEADDQRERGDNFKIQQGFEANATKLLQVPHRGDAVDDRAKDDRRNNHLD